MYFFAIGKAQRGSLLFEAISRRGASPRQRSRVLIASEILENLVHKLQHAGKVTNHEGVNNGQRGARILTW